MCSNLKKDDGESDIDCGGSACPPCYPGQRCVGDLDCLSRLCGAEDGLCMISLAPTATPSTSPTAAPTSMGDCSLHPRCVELGLGLIGVKSVKALTCCPSSDGETYLSCCDNTETPTVSPTTNAPSASPTPMTCLDDIKNGLETAVDCGGGACPPCWAGEKCGDGPRDCTSGRCVNATNSTLGGRIGVCDTFAPTRSPTASPSSGAVCSVHDRCMLTGQFRPEEHCCPAADNRTYFNCCDNTEAPTGSPSESPTREPTTSPTKACPRGTMLDQARV